MKNIYSPSRFSALLHTMLVMLVVLNTSYSTPVIMLHNDNCMLMLLTWYACSCYY